MAWHAALTWPDNSAGLADSRCRRRLPGVRARWWTQWPLGRLHVQAEELTESQLAYMGSWQSGTWQPDDLRGRSRDGDGTGPSAVDGVAARNLQTVQL